MRRPHRHATTKRWLRLPFRPSHLSIHSPNWRPLLDAGGTALGTVHVARDISEQKQAALRRDGKIEELRGALARARNLSGVLPICSFCKRIRNDRGYWEQVEAYVRDHSEACFTHSLCPECARTHYPGMAR